jgi:hypothetical protein
VRVYEVGTERIGDDCIDKALRDLLYLETVQSVAKPGLFIERIRKAEEEVNVAIKAWVKSSRPTIENI